MFSEKNVQSPRLHHRRGEQRWGGLKTACGDVRKMFSEKNVEKCSVRKMLKNVQCSEKCSVRKMFSEKNVQCFEKCSMF